MVLMASSISVIIGPRCIFSKVFGRKIVNRREYTRVSSRPGPVTVYTPPENEVVVPAPDPPTAWSVQGSGSVPTGLVTTTRLATERLTALPLVPVIVIGYDPAAAPEVVRVNSEPPEPATVGEENAAATCDGRPEALRNPSTTCGARRLRATDRAIK